MFVMTHPEYIRAKAVELRTQRNLSIDEIAERLALPRTTVFYWLRDLPIDRSARPRTLAQLNGSIAMQAKYRRLREAAYAEGRASSTSWRSTLRSATSSACTSRRATSGTATRCRCATQIRRWSCSATAGSAGSRVRRLHYRVQYHADQDLDELQRFWGAQLRHRSRTHRNAAQVQQQPARRPDVALCAWRARPCASATPCSARGSGLDGPAARVLALDWAFRGVAQPG